MDHKEIYKNKIMIEKENDDGRGRLLALVTMSDATTKEDRKKFMQYAKEDSQAWDRQIIFCPDMKGAKISFKLACGKIERLAKELKITDFKVAEFPLNGALGTFAKSVKAAHILIEIPPQEKKLLGMFDLDFLWESYIWKMVKATDIDVTIIDKGAIFAGYQEIVVPIDRWNNVHKLNNVVTIAQRFHSKVFLFTENPLMEQDQIPTVAALNNAVTKLINYKVPYLVVKAKNKNKFPLHLLKYTIKKQKKHVIVEVIPGKLPLEFLRQMKSLFNGKNPNLAITLVKYQKQENYRI